MLKNYIFIASGILSTIVVLRILFRKSPPPSPDYSDLPSLEDPDESSSEENVTVKRTLTSRANTYQKDEIVKRPKLTHMLKDELIEECVRRNIAVIGTARVLRERLRLAREEEKQA
jgi:hypothetical protein